MNEYFSNLECILQTNFPKDEINTYLSKLKIIPSINIEDPLDFWKIFQKEMPVLYSQAIKILKIPSSSATVERSFSYLKKILTPQRCSLTEESLSSHLRILFNSEIDFENND